MNEQEDPFEASNQNGAQAQAVERRARRIQRSAQSRKRQEQAAVILAATFIIACAAGGCRALIGEGKIEVPPVKIGATNLDITIDAASTKQ